MDQFEHRVAVVTGAASGIGRALARRLGEQGMRVVLADVESERLAEAVRDVEATGAEAIGVSTDVADAESVEALAASVWERFGGAHLLCNNAGVFQGGLTWECSSDDWEWVFGVNTYGIIHGIRAFVPRLIDQGETAHIVNTASMAGLITMPYSGPYVASKFAAFALSECLAHDLAAISAPIGVSVLCPSLVATDIGTSARNRPKRLPHDPSESADFVARALVDATADGIPPEAAADAVIEAVRSDTFLIPTRPSYERQIRDHAAALLRRELPEMPLID